MDEITVLAHRFDRETHFLFFFLFFLMISAWILKACASALIWSATYVSAVFTATRSAVAACCRIALAIFMPVNFPAFPWFPPEQAKPLTSSPPVASALHPTASESAFARRVPPG